MSEDRKKMLKNFTSCFHLFFISEPNAKKSENSFHFTSAFTFKNAKVSFQMHS